MADMVLCGTSDLSRRTAIIGTEPDRSPCFYIVAAPSRYRCCRDCCELDWPKLGFGRKKCWALHIPPAIRGCLEEDLRIYACYTKCANSSFQLPIFGLVLLFSFLVDFLSLFIPGRTKIWRWLCLGFDSLALPQISTPQTPAEALD